jgi:chaperonin GroEL
MAKDLTYEKLAREKLLTGAEKLAKTVGVTMGPQGKNVILGKYVGAPVLTKDGVTVAREVSLEDPVEELSCKLIKEAAGRTAAVAGDGTTTATVLTHEILRRGIGLINDNYSPLALRDGVGWALRKVVEELNSMAIEVRSLDDLRNIATISANNDPDIGDKIAEAFHSVGHEGTVVAEASPGTHTSVRFVDGVELSSGYITPAFVTESGQNSVSIQNCRILLCNEELSNLSSCLNIFNECSDKNIPLLIMAKSVKQEVLSTLVTNNKLGRLRSVAVQLPIMGASQDEWVKCISAITGSTIFSSESGVHLSQGTLEDLGSAKSILVSRNQTKIIEGSKNSELVKSLLDIYSLDLEKLLGDGSRLDVKRRVSFLSNKAAIVSVGYSTELELREKGDRVDDAICATRAAIEEGYVPGGGAALLRAASRVDLSELDERMVPAAKVLLDACARPITQITSNAFRDSQEIIKKVLKSDNSRFGYNAASDSFEDLVSAGVIDPKKVTRTAIENATSISLLIINTDAVVSEQKDNPSSWQPPAGWRPPEEGVLSHKY